MKHRRGKGTLRAVSLASTNMPDLNRVECQQGLFPEKRLNVFVFLDMSLPQKDRFFSELHNISPRLIIDVRKVPRFDFGRLSRKEVFRIFKELNITYIDAADMLSTEDIHRASKGFSLLQRNISRFADKSTLAGPLVVLFGGAKLDGLYLRTLPKLIRPPKGMDWDIYCINPR